jgi:ABC-type branched-subunit amino acid transport system substrate-binding protein
MEQLAQYVAKWHVSDNVIVIGTSSVKDAAYVTAFQKAYNTARFPLGNDSVKVLKGVTGLDALVSATANNVLVVPSNSQVFVTDLLRSLNTMADKDKKKFTLYGMPTWMTYENLDFSYLQTLNFHYATPYFIDYSDSLTKHFLRVYKQTCKGDASQYVFQGYDVTMFYLKALREYGTGLQQKLPEIKSSGLQQSFDFYQPDSESGYENRGVMIISMQDYQLVKERK